MILQAFPALEHYAEILDLAHDSVIALDLDGTIRKWNRGAERLLGYSAEDVVGKNVSIVSGNDGLLTCSGDHLARLLETGLEEFDGVVRTKFGELRPIHIRLGLLRDVEGRPAGLLSFAIDRAELERTRADLKEREGQLRTIVDAIPICVAHIGSDLRYRFVNRAYEELLGRPATDLVGRTVHEALAGQYVVPEACVRTVLAGNCVTNEETLYRANGERRLVSLQRVPDRGPDGTINGYFVVTLDITEDRRAEAERLDREKRLRETLVAEVHHRVKNALQGTVGLLRSQADRHPELLAALEPAIYQVLAVSVSFGLMSRRGIAGIVLCDVVQEVASNLERMTGRGIEMTLSAAIRGRPIEIDQAHGVNLSLVINELIFNAIKHLPDSLPSRQVTVALDREGNTATVRVASESRHLPEGFDFENGKALGLGLSLIRFLLPPHRCSLRFESSSQGVTAVLTLDTGALAPSPPPERGESSQAAAEPLKITRRGTTP